VEELASSSTFASKIGRHRDLEVGVVGGNGMGIGCIVGKVYQLVPNDSIRFGIHNGNIGLSSVWSANFDSHVNDLTRSECLDVGSVVGKLVPLAKPNVACGGIIILLICCNLKDSLDVTQAVGFLVVKNCAKFRSGTEKSKSINAPCSPHAAFMAWPGARGGGLVIVPCPKTEGTRLIRKTIGEYECILKNSVKLDCQYSCKIWSTERKKERMEMKVSKERVIQKI
jgi:hypothetical protein